MVGIISFVGQDIIRLKTLNQCVRLTILGRLSLGEQQPHRVAQRIDRRVNFGAKPAARLAHGLEGLFVFFAAPC